MRGCYVMALAVVLLLASVVQAQTGAKEYAERLNQTGSTEHDRFFNGSEVIFKSDGIATPEAAMAAWQKSRKGHAQLVASGAITDIQCSGGVCVGRGVGTTSSTVQRTKSTSRFVWRWGRLRR